MGNRFGKVFLCSAGAGDISRRHENNNTNPLRNSICCVRPPDPFSDDDVTTFRLLSGASVSANSSTPPSTVVLDSSASFESSTSSSSSMPLHHHHHHHDAWRAGSSAGSCSVVWWSPTTTEGGLFPSGPVPNEKGSSLEKKLRRSFSHKPRKQILKEILKRVVISGSIVVKGVVKKKKEEEEENAIANARVSGAELSLHEAEEEDDDNYFDDEGCGGDLFLMGSEKNLQWAQGRAGEDRVHIVISEEHGWVFVGIYDGFNGPDATDYLLHNLFYAVHDELKWILCGNNNNNNKVLGCLVKGNHDGLMVRGYCPSILDEENCPTGNYEKLDLDPVVKRMNSRNTSSDDVLLGLSEALRKTEDAFLRSVDEVICNNPVLAMMGSCVLVMLMKGEDVYLMNVGDSRAVLATHSAESIQLTMEHSTLVKQEVHRIRKEHPDDPCAITKGRVKGYLNVTRAFGAGFLKQPKQNNAILEAFKVNYIGDSPYITCSPSLHHHRLSPSDRFLILSSDGLHQYFTNEEAVAKVQSFITLSPDTDPAQLLINEALCRAAKKAGMDFHELLDIPQGERRLYHDDISIVIISFEGKIWRSSV